MRRDQLEHAIRTACQIIGHEEIGSQSTSAATGMSGHAMPPRLRLLVRYDRERHRGTVVRRAAAV